MSARELVSYKRTQVETASPLHLVVMLYDGAISNLKLARQAIVDGDVESKSRGIDKALAIIGELQATLDMERGGDIATSLNALYAYFCEQVVDGSVRLDPAPLDHVASLLQTVRSAWDEIAQRPLDETGKGLPGGVSQAPESRPRLSVHT